MREPNFSVRIGRNDLRLLRLEHLFFKRVIQGAAEELRHVSNYGATPHFQVAKGYIEAADAYVRGS